MKRKHYKTRRLELRAYRLSDWKTWFDAYVNRLPKMNRFDLSPIAAEKCSKTEFKKLKKCHEELAAMDNTYIYGAFERKSGKLIGSVDIFIICRDDRQIANLGYHIHNRYRGKGYGKEAAAAGLKIGFTQLGLNRLEASIDLDNPHSIKLAKKIKMTNEGIKKNYLFEDGKWIDQIVFTAIPGNLGFRSKKPIL